MPITAPKNLYRGVNPHLHSLFQSKRKNESPFSFRPFHTLYIGQLAMHLNQRLPPNYIAISDDSLQLVEPDEDLHPRPDVMIARESSAIVTPKHKPTRTPTWQRELAATLDPLDTLNAVKIQLVAQGALGEVVGWIELLSAANKPGGSYYEIYRTRRAKYVSSETPLVEIDFLHETDPVVIGLPIYPHDASSHPYHIAINDARPDVGKTFVYSFDVHQNIPTLDIPLIDDSFVETDFDEVYQTVFQGGRFGMYIDYKQLPKRFNRYSADDQQRIKTRMAEIAQENGRSS